MRRSFVGISAASIATWLALVGCGEDSSDDRHSGDSGSAGSVSGAGKATGGSATAGSNANAGNASGGSTRAGAGNGGGSDSGAAGAPEPSGDAGSGSSDGLVSCDPEQASCKVPPGECPTMQVREVLGTCWGDCVKIEQCACGSAAECPDSNQYTCWMGRHCGPYVN
jgi:hypothetical protein